MSDNVAVAAVRRAIEESHAAYSEAVSRGDAAALAATFAEDAIVLAPNAEAVAGRASIRAAIAAMLPPAGAEYRLTLDEVAVFGEVALDRGRYVLTMQVGDQVVVDRGKYMALWRRQPDGSWLVFRDMTNSSLPSTGAR